MRWSFLIALCLGLTLRLATVFIMSDITTDGPTDQASYAALGENLASGGHYHDYYTAPLYPGAVALVIQVQQIAGLDDLPIRLTVGILQTLFGQFAIGLFGWMICRRQCVLVGTLTMAGLAIWPNQVMLSGTVLTERLSTPLFLLGTTALLWDDRRPRHRQLLLAGIAFGLMVITRPALGPVVLVAAILAASNAGLDWRSRLTSILMTIAGTVLLLSMLIVYIRVDAGEWSSGSTAGGFNLCMGNSDFANGGWSEAAISHGCDLPPVGAAVTIKADRSEMRTGLRWMRSHLTSEPRLVRLRWRQIFEHDSDALVWYPSYLAYDGPSNVKTLRPILDGWWQQWKALSVIGLAICLCAKRSRRFTTGTLLLGAAQLITPLASVGEARYHDALVPLMALWVASAVGVVIQGLVARPEVEPAVP